MSSSGSSRLMAAPKRARSSKGSRSCRRRRIEYHGRTLEEFDLDAALARKPKLIVVDELAHTNAPDSRHPKRWQDVQELLDAGISVWTALNIQHLESLADVVSAHHGRRRARDRSRPGLAGGRRRRPGRPHARRTHPAPERRQGLCAGDRAAGDAEFLHSRQFDGLARTGAAAHRRSRRRSDGRLSAPEGDRGSVGGVRASARLRRGGRSVGTGHPARKPARDRPQRGLDRPSRSRPSARLPTPSAPTGSPKCSALAERLGGQTMRLQGSDYPTEILKLAARENCHSDRARPVAGRTVAPHSRAVAAGGADARRRRNRNSYRSGRRGAMRRCGRV